MENHWQKRGTVAWLLLPLSWVFSVLVHLRRRVYQTANSNKRGKFVNVYRAPLPVVVVGNITAGGSGKTPLVIALVQTLTEKGYQPGVVCRGYGASSVAAPRLITADTPTREGGDEPVMIAKRTDCPVVIHPRRADAVKHLLATATVDVIVCDDGLQHYALARDIEIAVISQTTGLGNRFLLPAGPLREAPARLSDVDFVVQSRRPVKLNQTDDVTFANLLSSYVDRVYSYDLRVVEFIRLDEQHRQTFEDVRVRGAAAFGSFALSQAEQAPPVTQLIAMAGIAYPNRFFQTLSDIGLDCQETAFTDHHAFTATDFENADGGTDRDSFVWLITEKDAIKCRELAIDKTRVWYCTTVAELAADFTSEFLRKLDDVTDRS